MVVVAFWMLDNLDDWNRITVFNHEEHKAHKGLAKVNRVLDDLDVLKNFMAQRPPMWMKIGLC